MSWRDQPRVPAGSPDGGQFAPLNGSPASPVASAYKEYAGINEYLRGDRNAALGSDKTNRDFIRKMDDLIHGQTLERDATLYRGFGDSDIVKLTNNKGFYSDRAYLSVTQKLEVATSDKFKGLGYVAEIFAPKGTPAYVFSGDKDQSEVVLPRSSKLKVIGVDHVKRVVKFKVVSTPKRIVGRT